MPIDAVDLEVIKASLSGIVQEIILWMQHRLLSEIIAEPEIQRLYEPLYQRHVELIDLIRNRARTLIPAGKAARASLALTL